MNLSNAIRTTLKSKRFWKWQAAGIILYAIPAAIRFATGSVVIPVLNFPGFWIGHFIPGNFLEKLLINAFFPGGAGAIAGEILVSNYKNEALQAKTKYLSRLGGAMLQTTAWSTFQYVGFSFLIIGPYGGNIFEHTVVFPINFTLAALSIFTPDVVDFTKSKLNIAYRKLSAYHTRKPSMHAEEIEA